MEPGNQIIHTLSFRINPSHLESGHFELAILEDVIDNIYDLTEDIDEELDIDISDMEMYITSNKIDEVLPVIKEVMDKSTYFDMTSLELTKLNE